MNQVEAIANAVLYEGFFLYPYRRSALKNRQRWNFGVVFPPRYSGVLCGSDSSVMQAECLVEGDENAVTQLRLRFLQHTGEDTLQREVMVSGLELSALATDRSETSIAFPELRGSLAISAERLESSLFKLTACVRNEGLFTGNDRDEALRQSFISTHLLLAVRGARFQSLTDPPENLRSQSSQCRNIGVWPVLAGDPKEASQILAAPIILEDYPRVAPQSPGDFFDSTEIDEMLSLRILTLSDAEKDEMRGAEERVRRLLERTEAIGAEELLALHGVSAIRPGTAPFKRGDRVRLHPRGGADAFDILLKEKTATVVSVEQTVENEVYLSVTIDDDPGKDLGVEGKIGHRFFFRPDEVERL